MNISDVLALANAGFSKDEIMQLVGAETTGNAPKTNEQTNGAQTIPSDEQTTQNAAVNEQTQTTNEQTQNNAPIMSDAQVKQLAQAINLGNASIDVPPSVTLDDKMQEHFKNLLLGKE